MGRIVCKTLQIRKMLKTIEYIEMLEQDLENMREKLEKFTSDSELRGAAYKNVKSYVETVYLPFLRVVQLYLDKQKAGCVKLVSYCEGYLFDVEILSESILLEEKRYFENDILLLEILRNSLRDFILICIIDKMIEFDRNCLEKVEYNLTRLDEFDIYTRMLFDRECSGLEIIEKSIADLESKVSFEENRFRFPALGICKLLDFEIDKVIEKWDGINTSRANKIAMCVVEEKMLREGYDKRFIAGVLGNIVHEGEPGLLENSAYSKEKESEMPKALKIMNDDCHYLEKYSNKYISDLGIKAISELLDKAKEKNGKFGMGMVQWTDRGRVEGLIELYEERCGDKGYPSKLECAEIEATYIVKELKEKDYINIYSGWKEGEKTPGDAARKVCIDYEAPFNKAEKADERAVTAEKIYKLMEDQE